MSARNETAATPAAVGVSDIITPQYRRYALLMLVLVFMSSHVDRNIMGILIEPIKQDLQVSDTYMGFLSGFAFAIFYATLGIPIAIWADRGNRRNIIALALTIWSGMTVLCGFAANFWQLALARIGVGVGEAGSSPPSHSIIADMYAPHERSTAMSIFSLGINFGIMFGFLIGGWVAEWWGWRMAFIIVGAPGLLLAVIVKMTVKEPPRGHSEGLAMTRSDAPTFGQVARFMLTNKSIRHILAGGSLTIFVGYGMVQWIAPFFIRSHGMSPGEVGTLLAFMVGVIGGLGTFSGGWLADRMSVRDGRWNVWVVAAAKVTTVPFVVAFFLVEDTWLAVAIYVIPGFLGGFYLGPSFSMMQSLVPLRMRSVAAAVFLFTVNIIGLGFGPQTVGILSDLFRASYGTESLRYALLCFSLVNLWAAFHYYRAGATLRDDLANANR